MLLLCTIIRPFLFLFLLVATGTSRTCQSKNRITLTGRTGIIPSVSADEHGYGTRSCPWVLQAAPGQRLNITLQDFGLAVRMGSDGSRFASSLVCQRYAVLKEAQSKSSTVCGGEQRLKNIYISDTNTVQVEVIPSRAPRATTEFLLRYSGTSYHQLHINDGPYPSHPLYPWGRSTYLFISS